MCQPNPNNFSNGMVTFELVFAIVQVCSSFKRFLPLSIWGFQM